MILEQALGLAFAHLGRRERTVDEVRRHLLTRHVEAALAEQAVRELIAQGYLDDARFARLFAQDRRELDRWGSGRIRQALLERGVPAEVADRALAGGSDSGDAAGALDEQQAERERALALLAQRFPEAPQDRRASDRALGVLLRRGYEYELAVDALAEHRRRAIAPGRVQ